MSIFSSILAKIFPGRSAPAAGGATTAPATTSAGAPTAAGSPTAAPTATPAPAPTAAPMAAFDVEQLLNERAASNPQKLNWRTSIVDLLKLLDLDSSLAARKSLAAELHFTGDTNDSAAMNVWLHRQVMNKLAQNGGKVPKELMD